MRPRSVIVLCVALGCGESEQAREEAAMRAAIPKRLQEDGTLKLTPADVTALGLVVQPAGERDLGNVQIRFGVVRPRLGEDAIVVAPVAGRIVSAPSVALGAIVIAGQPIIEIEPVLATSERIAARVQVADLGGQVSAAQKELSAREAELARIRPLERDKIVSTAKLQDIEATVAATRARLEALKNARNVQGGAVGGRVQLKAPVAGSVVALDASMGAVVGPGDVLARVLKPGPVWIDLAVPPDDAAGQRYEIAMRERTVPARLVARGAVVGEDGTRSDRLEADAASGLLPGARVQVRIATGEMRGPTVPEAAIVPTAAGDAVFVEVAANTFAARPVVVAARFGGEVRLASGIKAGERVVTRGAMSLRGESLRAELRHTE